MIQSISCTIYLIENLLILKEIQLFANFYMYFIKKYEFYIEWLKIFLFINK